MDHPFKEELESSFKGIQVTLPRENQLVITADKEAVISLLSYLKNHGYDHLGLVSCVDWMEKGLLEIVYVLHSYMENDTYTNKVKEHVLLKVTISRERAECLSAIPIFENAEPYERELHELYGIEFDGHPRLTPLFLEREYGIPPFRKDFDTRIYVEDTYDSIPFVDDGTDHT